MTKGKLIILEGLDGSGKGTQFENLKQYFSEQKIAFSTYDFPQYYDTFWGKMVGKYLNKEYGENVNPYLASLLFFLDQSQAAPRIRQDLKTGKIVLCNRYTTSNVYQAAKLNNLKERDDYWTWLEQAAYQELQVVPPDLVIVLSISPKTARSLIAKKNAREYVEVKEEDKKDDKTNQQFLPIANDFLPAKKDLHEDNLKLQEDTYKELIRQCKRNANWVTVNCLQNGKLRTIAEIFTELKQVVANFLNKK